MSEHFMLVGGDEVVEGGPGASVASQEEADSGREDGNVKTFLKQEQKLSL